MNSWRVRQVRTYIASAATHPIEVALDHGWREEKIDIHVPAEEPDNQESRVGGVIQILAIFIL